MCRLIIDDGSGLGLIDCYDDLITDAIEIPPLEWSNLLEIVKSCGKVYYSQQNTSWVHKWLHTLSRWFTKYKDNLLYIIAKLRLHVSLLS